MFWSPSGELAELPQEAGVVSHRGLHLQDDVLRLPVHLQTQRKARQHGSEVTGCPCSLWVMEYGELW